MPVRAEELRRRVCPYRVVQKHTRVRQQVQRLQAPLEAGANGIEGERAPAYRWGC